MKLHRVMCDIVDANTGGNLLSNEQPVLTERILRREDDWGIWVILSGTVGFRRRWLPPITLVEWVGDGFTRGDGEPT